MPILALRTEQNISNELILQPRWGYVAIAVLLAFVGALSLPLWRRSAALPVGARSRRSAQAGRATIHRLARSALLYPMLALAVTGKAGAIKWIDNFGIQILIYIMLGWGLNIVVGLAGLLDLGYVAFYAVGAYAYALFATSDPIKDFMAEWVGAGFWPAVGVLDLPARGRPHGGLLGHPARLSGVAAARRLSGHRHPGVRRDHSPRAHQLGAGHQRLRRHLRHSAAHLLRPSVQRQR